VSSVYTQIVQMRQMLRAISDPFEAHAEPIKMVQSMAVVMHADSGDVIKFLPLILTHLFRLICTSAGGHAFILLASLMSRLLTDADATGVLMSYAEHTFQSAKMGELWIHDETIKHWFAVAKASSDPLLIENYLRSSRFLFQVIFKVCWFGLVFFFKKIFFQIQSMVYRTRSGDQNRAARFSSAYVRDLEGKQTKERRALIDNIVFDQVCWLFVLGRFRSAAAAVRICWPSL
jgi:hypothetical protein